jgi:uncharacterized membrane protein
VTMKFQDYRTVFQVSSLVLVLLAASPALSLIVSFPRSVESFSELWLLGSNHMAENFPFNVQTGEEISLFLGVGNHLGHSGYYLVYAKFRNQTQPLPNGNSSEPSSLHSIHEFQFLLADGDVWETPVTFEILDASVEGDSMVVESVSVNDRAFEVDCSSTWDSENKGFYFQLFFELWLYNSEGSSFQFNDRFVGIWLNMTG